MESINPDIEDGHQSLQIITTEPLWTVDEVAAFLRLKEETAHIEAPTNKIPAVKVGKVWRFRASDIKAMLNIK